METVKAICPSCLTELKGHYDGSMAVEFKCPDCLGTIPFIIRGEEVIRAWHYSFIRVSHTPIPKVDLLTAPVRVRRANINPVPDPDQDIRGRALRMACLVCGRRPEVREGGYYHEARCRHHPTAPVVFALVDEEQRDIRVWVGQGWHEDRGKGIVEYVGMGDYSKRMTHTPGGPRIRKR